MMLLRYGAMMRVKICRYIYVVTLYMALLPRVARIIAAYAAMPLSPLSPPFAIALR